MAWITCPHCGFTQIPSARCLKCRKSFDRPPAAGAGPPAAEAARADLRQVFKSIPRAYLAALAGLALAVVAGVLLWSRSTAISAEAGSPTPLVTPEPWSFDLTGRWEGRAPT